MSRRPADQSTALTLGYLHAARWSSRDEKRRSRGLALYVVALLAAFWGIPGLVLAARHRRPEGAAGHGGPTAVAAGHVLASLPVTLPVLLLLVVAAMAWAAVWRGPLAVDVPTVHWLLRTPLPRAPLLLPRLARASALAAAVGLVVGGAAGFLLCGYGPGSRVAASAGGAWAGLTAAVAGSALGVGVERYEAWVARHGARLFALAPAVLALAVGGAGALVAAGTPGWSARLLLWSGPWGWAAQPLVSALGGGGGGRWAVGGALSAVCTAALARGAWRAAPGTPVAALGRRATVAAAVGAAVTMLDLRRARAGMSGPWQARARPLVRLPVPRHPLLLVPWRDATALLRAPGRLSRAALWTAAAAPLILTARQLTGTGQDLACVAGLVALYLGAAQLTEPARLESDDIRRRAALPWSAAGLALRHAIVPVLLLYLALGVTAAVCAALGAAGVWLAVLGAAVPALVGAALVSSYRGTVPVHVLVGAQTPMGNTGPFQTALWYLRGPLAVLLGTAPVLLAVLRGGAYPPVSAVVQLVAAGGALWWAGRTARRLHAR